MYYAIRHLDIFRTNFLASRICRASLPRGLYNGEPSHRLIYFPKLALVSLMLLLSLWFSSLLNFERLLFTVPWNHIFFPQIFFNNFIFYFPASPSVCFSYNVIIFVKKFLIMFVLFFNLMFYFFVPPFRFVFGFFVVLQRHSALLVKMITRLFDWRQVDWVAVPYSEKCLCGGQKKTMYLTDKLRPLECKIHLSLIFCPNFSPFLSPSWQNNTFLF